MGYLAALLQDDDGPDAASLVFPWDNLLGMPSSPETALAQLQASPKMSSPATIALLERLRARLAARDQPDDERVVSGLIGLAESVRDFGAPQAVRSLWGEPRRPEDDARTRERVDELVRSFEDTREIGSLTCALDEARRLIAGPTSIDNMYFVATLSGWVYELTGDVAKLDAAVALDDQILGALGEDADALLVNEFAQRRRQRFEHCGDPMDLRASIDLYRQALNISTDDAERVALLVGLAATLRNLANETGQVATIDEAITHLRAAIELMPAADVQRPVALNNLGNALRARFRITYDRRDLDDAIDLHEEAVRAIEPSAATAGLLHNLANALFQRFEIDLDLADASRAIATYERATRLPDLPDELRARILDGAGTVLALRATIGGDDRDFERSIDQFRAAIELVAPDTSRHVDYASNLTKALVQRYMDRNDPRDLDEAIASAERLIAKSPAAAHELLASDLAAALRMRFHSTGDLEDLDRALNVAERTVEATEPGWSAHTRALMNVALLLREGHRVRPDPEQLDRAIELGRKVLESDASRSLRSLMLGNLGGSLGVRFATSGVAADLDEAIALSTEAIAAGPPPEEMSTVIGDLAGALVMRWQLHHRSEDFEAARTKLQEAIELAPEGSFHRSRLLSNLATFLTHPPKSNDPDPTDARETFRAACEEASEHAPAMAMHAGASWGRWAMSRQAWCEAREAFTYAVAGASSVIRTQLLSANRHERQRDARAIFFAAAHAAARNSELADSALLIERGRALAIGDALEGSRLALDEVLRTSAPRLHARYLETASRVRGLDGPPPVLAESTLAALAPAAIAQSAARAAQRRAARREVDAVIERIRELEGYEDVLSEPSPSLLDDPDADAPTLYLMPGDDEGYALVLQNGTDPAVVWLPTLTSGEVIDRATQMFDAYVTSSAAWSDAINDVAGWLWTAAAGPLRERLPHARRWTVIPGGLLAIMPLHAARQQTPDGPRYLLDDVCITYAPSLRVRRLAQAHVHDQPAERILAVAVPDIPNATPLRFVSHETAGVTEHFANAVILSSHQATGARVRAALGPAHVVHFACHAYASGRGGALVLQDAEQLSIADLVDQRMDNTRLAVLSACEAALPDLSAPDEMLSLQGALLRAGVGGVVASTWAIGDASACFVMLRFYELWRQSGHPPVEALRHSQRWVRDSTNAEKAARFPFVGALLASHVAPDRRAAWDAARDHGSLEHWATFTYMGA